jgi:hypothetical protein
MTAGVKTMADQNGVQKPPGQQDGGHSSEGPPWRVVAAFLWLAVAALVLYGWSVGSAALVFIEFLVGAGSLSVGALIGFLFGMPRSALGQPGRESDANPEDSGVGYQPSTNLEQVSDWLTKILIGVGLVELSQLGDTLGGMGRVVADSLQSPPQGTHVVTQVVIVAFLVLGFITSFLWTRIYYGPLQTLSDVGLVTRLRKIIDDYKQRLSEERESKEKVEEVANALARGEVVTPGSALVKARADVSGDTEQVIAEWPPDIQEKFDQFKAAPDTWDSDPSAELFPDSPQEAHGRRLEAEILLNMGDGLIINLTVKRTRGEPLKEAVTFLLHPTFPEPVLHVKPKGDLAEWKIYAGGWFTVVAILDGGRTVLSYSLQNLPNAPEWFANG